MSCCQKLKQSAVTDQKIDCPKYHEKIQRKSVIEKNNFIEEKKNMTISGAKKKKKKKNVLHRKSEIEKK